LSLATASATILYNEGLTKLYEELDLKFSKNLLLFAKVRYWPRLASGTTAYSDDTKTISKATRQNHAIPDTSTYQSGGF
jgi:alpha-glucuronidase